MNPISSNSVVSQIYNGIQGRGNTIDASRNAYRQGSTSSEFRLPQNATPQGEWVLSENANPQNFDANAQRGTYLNVVV